MNPVWQNWSLFQVLGLGRWIFSIFSAAKCHSAPPPIKANWTPCELLALHCSPSVTRVRPEERNIALIHSAHTHAHTQKPDVVAQAGEYRIKWNLSDWSFVLTQLKSSVKMNSTSCKGLSLSSSLCSRLLGKVLHFQSGEAGRVQKSFWSSKWKVL